MSDLEESNAHFVLVILHYLKLRHICYLLQCPLQCIKRKTEDILYDVNIKDNLFKANFEFQSKPSNLSIDVTEILTYTFE